MGEIRPFDAIFRFNFKVLFVIKIEINGPKITARVAIHKDKVEVISLCTAYSFSINNILTNKFFNHHSTI